MGLLDTFSKRTLKELVIILESGSDYTLEAKKAATTIIELKKVAPEDLVTEASNFWKTHLKTNIKRYLLSKEKPKSKLLDDKQIGDLFKEAFENWKESQKTFEIDTTKYWFV